MSADTLAASLGIAICLSVMFGLLASCLTDSILPLTGGTLLGLALSLVMGLGYGGLLPGVTNPPPLRLSRAEAEHRLLKEYCRPPTRHGLAACRRLADANRLATMRNAFPTP